MKSESVTPTGATSSEEETLLEGPSFSPAWVAWGEGTRKGRDCLFRSSENSRTYARVTRASWASCCGELPPAIHVPPSRVKPPAKASNLQVLLAGEKVMLWLSEHVPNRFPAPHPPHFPPEPPQPCGFLAPPSFLCECCAWGR